MVSKQSLYILLSLMLTKFMLTSRVMLRLLLLSRVNKDVVNHSPMNCLIFSLHDLRDMYMLPTVIVFDKLFPVI